MTQDKAIKPITAVIAPFAYTGEVLANEWQGAEDGVVRQRHATVNHVQAEWSKQQAAPVSALRAHVFGKRR